jgi:drug/metabolite transporter superfamily protein YnfA
MNFAILSAWITFIAAALLEAGGDATIRHGLRQHRTFFVLGGCLALGCYGLLVNSVKWDFSKLMGVYIAIFATVSILLARWALHEKVPATTWLGVALIVAGGLVIQFGGRS